MTFDNEHMLRDFARLLREARPIPAHTAVTVLDEAAAELADLRAENARLNAMRQHCERCGGDYLATGVETGCPCALRAENIALHERVAALESPEVCTVAHDDVATCGYCQRDAYKEDAANYYRLAKEADSQQAALRARDAELSALLEACAPYLKDGETPAERIERERRDVSTAVKALAHERVRNAELRVRVADCFMIIRRLAHNGSAPNRAMAIDFLKRHGETGDILRDDPSAGASHTDVPT